MGYRWSHVHSEEKPSRSARMPASSSEGQSVYWFQQRAPNLMSFMATSVRGSDLGRRRGRDALAGADPAEALERLGDRVNHIHAKDVRLEVLRRAKEERRADFETWWADVSCL